MEQLTAKDVMTSNVVTIRDDAPLSELVSLLSEHVITGAPVVDSSGKLVGVVSATDVAREGARRRSGVRREVPPDFYMGSAEFQGEDMRAYLVEEESDQLVRDIMTSMIFSVPQNASVAEMADTMIGGRVHRLIVTDGSRVVGIVTTLDILRGLRNSLRGI
ncbi:MAG TPA: CBS domain-containing protein [Vicinamibacteria bacterium]|nr:CBS domain-containing protein [Vicinamibacteria bacterium]